MESPRKDEPVAHRIQHTTYGFRHCGFMLIIMAVLVLLVLFLPYTVAMFRTSMSSFLPIVSQSGGTPPMSGLFAIILTIIAFTGFFQFLLLHQTVAHRNIYGLRKIRIANNLGLLCSCIFCLGAVIVATNPEGFNPVPNKFELVVTVLLEHALGANMIFLDIIFWVFLNTWIWFLLPDTSKPSKYIKLVISVLYVLIILLAIKPTWDYIWEKFEPFNIELLKDTTYEFPLVFNTSYKISAFCEWSVIFLVGVYLLFFFKEFQRISFHVELRQKSRFRDTSESSSSIILKPLSQ